MKKMLILLVMLASVSLAYSQCGTIYATAGTPLYPSLTTNFPDAKQNHPYSAVLQVYCYNYNIQGVGTIGADSFILESITGLPVGFTYTVSSRKLTPNQAGCFIITCNNVTAPIGGNMLTFKVKRYGYMYVSGVRTNYYDMWTIGGPGVADYYHITIGAGSVGINETNLLTNTKTYFSDNLLKVESTEQLNGANISISNMLGQRIKSEPISSDYSHDMNVSELTQGIYIVTIEKGGKMYQRKIFKN